MYEYLIERALETGANVVECGLNRLYPYRTIVKQKKERTAVREKVETETPDWFIFFTL